MAASCAATGAYTHQLPLPHPHLPSSGMILPSFFFLLFFFFAIWITTAPVHSRSLFLKQLCLVCMFLFALEIHICNMVEFCFCFPLNDRLLLLPYLIILVTWLVKLSRFGNVSASLATSNQVLGEFFVVKTMQHFWSGHLLARGGLYCSDVCGFSWIYLTM